MNIMIIMCAIIVTNISIIIKIIVTMSIISTIA